MRVLLRNALITVVVVIAILAGAVWWAGSGTLATLSWTASYGSASDRADTLTVVTYNIGYLSGLTNNRPVAPDPDAFERRLDSAVRGLAAVEPDLIAFQEIDVASRRSFYVDQPSALARRLALPEAAVTVNWDERYVPFPSASPRFHFGKMVSAQAVVGRYAYQVNRRVELPAPRGAPLYGTDTWFARLAMHFYIDRLAQVVVLDTNPSIALVNVHLEAWDAGVREEQAARVRELYDSLRTTHAVLVVGDFNTVMSAEKHAGRLASPDVERFMGDRSLDRLQNGSALRNALPDSIFASDHPSTFSYASDDPGILIDHIFYDSTRFERLDGRVLDLDGHPSDHRPVVARLIVRSTD